jgi:hypothetical protein
MPILWERVDLFSGVEWPKGIFQYPGLGSKRALSYVGNLSIGVWDPPIVDVELEARYPTGKVFHRLSDQLSTSLKVLRDAGSVHSMSLVLGLYEPNKYPSECTNIIETCNRTVLEILRHVAKMKIREFDFHPGEETTRIEDITSIIKQKVDTLSIFSLPLGDWAGLLQRFESLKAIIVRRDLPKNLQAESTFWIAVSQMPKLTTVRVKAIPLPPRLNISFPQLVHLEIHLRSFVGISRIEIGEVSNSILAIFTFMPALEIPKNLLRLEPRDSARHRRYADYESCMQEFNGVTSRLPDTRGTDIDNRYTLFTSNKILHR